MKYITIILFLAFALTTMYQRQVIDEQGALIHSMSQNPSCMEVKYPMVRQIAQFRVDNLRDAITLGYKKPTKQE